MAKAKPDGYTILAGGMSPLIIVPIVKKLDYRYDDLLPVGIYAKMPLWLAVKADSRWKALKDLVAEAKKSPGKLMAATYGKGTASHFGLDLFNRRAGIELTHVPYKSSGETLTAVMGGHADCAFATGSGALLEAGSVRILAIVAEQRLEDLPAIPTFLEFGYPVSIPGWFTLCFPKGTPKEILEKFYGAQKQAFERNAKEMKEGLRRVDQWMALMNPQESRDVTRLLFKARPDRAGFRDSVQNRSGHFRDE